MDRNKSIALALWVGSTALLEWVAYAVRDALFGVRGAEQALVVDDAFMLLTYLAIPVFTLVWVMIGVSIVRFRDRGDNEDAGDSQQSAKFHAGWAWSWLIWSSGLCLLVMIVPGWTGLMELRSTADKTPDLTIEVTGQRWLWQFYYKDHDVWLINPKENLVLPNDSLIRFKITSRDDDVLHSFWIPAFRQKIDAVPGVTTYLDVTTNRIGSYAEDVNYRVQCAELCGLGHSVMSQPVQVVEKSEFADWITTTLEATASSGLPLSSTELVEAGKIAFQSSCVACHGFDATGVPGLGKDLVTSTFVEGLGDDELVTFIKTGRSSDDPLNTTGLEMPANGGISTLSDDDIRAIVAWLRSMKRE